VNFDGGDQQKGVKEAEGKEVASDHKEGVNEELEILSKSAKSGPFEICGSYKSFKSTRNKKVIFEMVSIWVNRVLDIGVEKLMKEFRKLPKYKKGAMTKKAFSRNKALNRYVDVPCQDARRVILKWPGINNDYIHANYVATPRSDHHFICTQGPLENTMHAFWAMVLQEKSDYVLMLCNVIECDRVKCEQYWPREIGEAMVFGENNDGRIVVTSMDAHPMSDEDFFIRVSKLRLDFIENGNDATRVVSHYHWENWPDRGVPSAKLTPINLLAEVRDSNAPIIVHCSAGIGRTGTIVAISYVQEKMQNGVSHTQSE
ncbi:Protein-tyrosine phosphatase, partial [Oesophagostomum dentatum]